jgi:hypothetical protein
MKARFGNVLGYKLGLLGMKKGLFGTLSAEYLFTLDLSDPLTFHDDKGGRYQPNRKYTTDMGSIPKPLQLLIPKDKYLLSFFFHDSEWAHGGIWYCPAGCDEFVFIETSKKQSNQRLKKMVLVEGAMYSVRPGTLKREARWIKKAVDLAAFWARITKKKARHARAAVVIDDNEARER